MSVEGASASTLLARMNSGELTSVEVTTACLDAIRKHDPTISAFLLVDESRALEQAAAVDQLRKHKKLVGPLGGLPVAIKDVLCTKGERTTCASRMLENFVPPYDAHVVEKLRNAGAVLIGKTNMDEFAMGSSTENSAFQTTRNPWNTDCAPGGSSGGSAAAVAAGMAPLAIGTDTGEANVRARVPLWSRRVRELARPDRSHGERRHRSGNAPAGNRGARQS
jgi:aspartyl-tRNA(Asn)/glutamyl-tRNA(Gln) amidotransferase subunit A